MSRQDLPTHSFETSAGVNHEAGTALGCGLMLELAVAATGSVCAPGEVVGLLVATVVAGCECGGGTGSTTRAACSRAFCSGTAKLATSPITNNGIITNAGFRSVLGRDESSAATGC